jgi:hypothetical protein
MKFILLALLAPATLLAATAEDIKADKRVAAIDSGVFCFKLGPAVRQPIGKDEAYRAAMLRRAERSAGITGAMQGAINVRELILGMNLCAVLAAFGRPSHANRTTMSHGVHWQLVYDHPKRYIYLDDDKVTAWQE